MKFLFIILFTLSFSFSYVSAQTFSEKQKLEDFEYMYTTLKNNYPLFEVAKRQTGKDWLGMKQEFIDSIKKTNSDKEYLNALNEILKKLNNGHIDVFPSVFRNQLLESYKKFKMRDRWLKELEKGNDFWADLYNVKNNKEANSKYVYDSANVSLSYLKNNTVVVLKIKSFEDDFLKHDKEKLIKYLQQIKNETVIIDLQGNGGGTEEYWRNYIVPYLTSTKLHYKSSPLVFRNGEYVSAFFDNEFQKERTEVKNKESYLKKFPNAPKEISNTDYIIYADKKFSFIHPKRNNRFKNKIYLLVDDGVFSSSESLALFAKETKWATVAGQRTKGDGGSFDPVLLCLPHSKIILRFSAGMSLNSDGSVNAEMGTTPDILIEGNTSEERLNNLLKRIE